MTRHLVPDGRRRRRRPPVDAFNLNFAKIEISYKEQNETGGLGSETKASWDPKQNRSRLSSMTRTRGRPRWSPPTRPSPIDPADDLAELRAASPAPGSPSVRSWSGSARRPRLARPDDHAPHLRRRDGDEPARRLIRICSCSKHPSATDDRGLDRLGEDGLEGSASSRHDDLLGAPVRLIPHDELVAASDRGDSGWPPSTCPVYTPSTTLANLTVRRPAGRARPRHRQRDARAARGEPREPGVATDVNARALALSRFNLGLNVTGTSSCARAASSSPSKASAST